MSEERSGERCLALHRQSVCRTAHSLLLGLRGNCSYGVDLDGHPVMLARSTAPAIVLFFTASDCPISNRYEPEMLRLEQEFGPSRVEFCGCIRS